MASDTQFMYVESPQQPLAKMEWGIIKKNIINPITNKPYKGIILEGCFADLSDKANNNNRIYDIPSYLNILAEFRKKVLSKKGVYGEYEHPNSYAVNGKEISHKILDVWYDENTQKVMGYILLLNTVNGKKAREIVESGGCLAVSARAAGDEVDTPSGTKAAKIKLLTTYDLVTHPGFSDAILQFKELNESEKFIQSIAKEKNGYYYIIRNNDIKNMNREYKTFSRLNENMDTECFLEWYGKKLYESDNHQKQQEKQDEKKMQDNQLPNQQHYQDNLQSQANQELNQEQYNGCNGINVLNESDKKLFTKKLKKGQLESFININSNEWMKIDNEPLFDGSAGFAMQGLDI